MTWNLNDIPDQSGRTAVVTGGSRGLGLASAEALAGRGAHVILASRPSAAADEAVRRVRAAAGPGGGAEHRALDLADLESVRLFAADLVGEPRSVDLLINNAGIMTPPLRRSPQGFESQLAVNHLGHVALTLLLISGDALSARARVVTVSSGLHRIASTDFDDPRSERSYNRARAYGRSKLANLLFGFELDRRLRAAGSEMSSLVAHPGHAESDLRRDLGVLGRTGGALLGRLVGQSTVEGALSQLRAATDPTAEGGQFYGPAGRGQLRGTPVLVTPSAAALDLELAARVWEISERLTGVHLEISRRPASH